MTGPVGTATSHPGSILRSQRGRLLDPGQAGSRFAPTAYNSQGLIVAAGPDNARRVGSVLTQLLRDNNCDMSGPRWLGDAASAAPPPASYVTGVRIRPLGPDAPDPWALLTTLRQDEPDVAGAVGLNHLLVSPERVGGNPLAIGHGRTGLDAYGQAAGGRGVVSLLGPPPRPRRLDRRPLVVILDTEIGRHPWFADDPPRSRFRMKNGSLAGDSIHPYLHRDGAAASTDGVPARLLGALPSRAGHGTFIAGVIRQECPEAAIIALPVMGVDGAVPEHMLIRALDLILAKQSESPGWADAIVLSLGYYAETTADLVYTSGLKKVLLQLGQAGIATFASAGNDCTARPSYPAALAVDPAFADAVPVVSVGALNADLTLATFSNNGPWVTTAALGVNVVSTAAALDGSAIAAVLPPGRAGRVRAGADPDDFRGGFASWSGTSFAAPLAAAGYLNTLIDKGFPDTVTARRDLLPGWPQPPGPAAADGPAAHP